MTKNTHKTAIAAALAAAVITAALAGCAAHSHSQAQASLLPARMPPPGLQAGHAQIELAQFAPPATRPTWLGRTIVAEPFANFPVAAPRALATVAPTSGKVGVRWRSWYRAPATGAYILAASIAGGDRQGDLTTALVLVDGQRWPTINDARGACHGMTRGAGCEAGATTAAGAVRLARGWHEITIEAASDATAAPHAAVALSIIRAPGASAAEPLAPYWPAAAAK